MSYTVCREFQQNFGIGQSLQTLDFVRHAGARVHRQEPAGVFVELGSQFLVGHGILGGAAIVFFHFCKLPAVLQRYGNCSLEAARTWIIRIDAIAYSTG
jgi:hypothetical protein